MTEFDEDFHAIFDPIAQEFDESLKPPTLPYAIAPFQYAGMGSFVPEEKPVEAPLFHFIPTLPTMTIERKRDLITGEVIGYEDFPISTDLQDDGMNRPILSGDDYVSGSSKAFNVQGTKGPSRLDNIDFDKMVSALDTGMGLLSSPLGTPETEVAEAPPLPSLPEGEPIQPTRVQSVWKEEVGGEECQGIVDDWDESKFDEEIDNPVCRFPYQLDAFQKRSIRRLERQEHVFVSAPTSAGKTVVAQYAISLCTKHNARAIYTSPIKALSNQKYRDFSKIYDSVGILTGDVTLNRDATVLIMTTEILRQMLYRGADILRDVECVVFDECHYISDPERGVVWEECIIMMPPHITMVFLSATVPNDAEIASWVARTKGRDVYIERHEKRPVPLEHHLYVEGHTFSIYKGDSWNEKNYEQAVKMFRESAPRPQGRKGPGGKKWKVQKGKDWYRNLVRALQKEQKLPALIFSFSQKMVAQLGKYVSNLSLVDSSDKAKIVEFTRSALSRLPPEDRQLPDVTETVMLMENGIGVHHGGMLPVLKECVEILFSEGHLKVLFCTSTFAMGINAPARTCVFTQMRKFNGKNDFSNLTPTEYIQMSGRAGRRGLDNVGNVIILCIDEVLDRSYLQTIVKGKSEKLESHFYLRPNMVLNLVRGEGVGMTDFMKRSLQANRREKEVPELQRRLADWNESIKNFTPIDCIHDIEDTLSFASDATQAVSEMRALEQVQKGLHRHIAVGSVVLIAVMQDGVVTIGVVTETHSSDKYTVLTRDDQNPKKVFLAAIIGVFRQKLQHVQRENATAVQEQLAKLVTESRPVPLKQLLKSSAANVVTLSDKLDELYASLISSPCFNCAKKVAHTKEAHSRIQTIQRRDDLERQLGSGQSEYQHVSSQYISFLADFQYMRDNVITLKGRVSIELQSTADEILASELLFRNTFTELPVADICAVCAALVGQRAGKDNEDSLPQHLGGTIGEIEEIAKNLCDRMVDHGVTIDPETWVEEHVNRHVVKPVHVWALGESFATAMRYAQKIPSGQLARVITQAAQLLTAYSRAAKLIGNTEMADKFEEASTCILHGVVCCPSLYLS